ncbi:class I tRNA ligase family protein [bacterium]|nr:class I tRNA ligase family protein [bacterium]
MRRSRRRFRASGMDEDKISAYSTLFEVLNTFVKIAAPFAPFISEYIYLELQNFTNK